MLERVRHEVGEDHAIGRVPADEERPHQEPELRDVQRFLDVVENLTGPPTPPPARVHRPRRVLVVEDEVPVRNLMTELIRHERLQTTAPKAAEPAKLCASRTRSSVPGERNKDDWPADIPPAEIPMAMPRALEPSRPRSIQPSSRRRRCRSAMGSRS